MVRLNPKGASMLTRQTFLTLTPAAVWLRLIVSLASLMRQFMALPARSKMKALRPFEKRLGELEHFAALLLSKFTLGLALQPAPRAAPRTIRQTERVPPQASSAPKPSAFHLPKALRPVLFPGGPCRAAPERKAIRPAGMQEKRERPGRLARFFRRAGALRRLLLQPDKFSASLARRLHRRAQAALGTLLPYTEDELARLMQEADTLEPAAPQEAAPPGDDD